MEGSVAVGQKLKASYETGIAKVTVFQPTAGHKGLKVRKFVAGGVNPDPLGNEALPAGLKIYVIKNQTAKYTGCNRLIPCQARHQNQPDCRRRTISCKCLDDFTRRFQLALDLGLRHLLLYHGAYHFYCYCHLGVGTCLVWRTIKKAYTRMIPLR